MTPNEFKEKYPQYKHLQGDELWDVMTVMIPKLEDWRTLTAEPNREIQYLPSVELVNGGTVQIEDDSKTVWLDEKGDKVKLKETTPEDYKGSTSYEMVIWDGKTMKYDK